MTKFTDFLNKMGYSWNDFDRTYEMKNLIEQYADEAVREALQQAHVISSVCDHPEEALIRDKPTPYCLACNKNIPEQTDL